MDTAPAKKPSLAQFIQIWNLTNTNFGKIPQHHQEIADWLQSTTRKKNRLLQAYRHSGKSDMTCLYVAWRLLINPNYSVIIVSAGAGLASRNSSYIRDIITRHPLTQHLKPNDDSLWQKQRFTVKRGGTGLHPSVQVTSITSAMTGLHGDEVIADDIETSENCRSSEGRERIARATQEIFNLAPRRLFVGTPHHEETIYNIFDDPKLNVYALRLPIYKDDGTPRWPEHHDEEWIEEKKAEATTGVWQSQYLLIPTRAFEAYFDVEMINRCGTHLNGQGTDTFIQPDEIRMKHVNSSAPLLWLFNNELREGDGKWLKVSDLRAFWDPATGQRNRDSSVIAIAAKTEDEDIYVLECEALPPATPEQGMKSQMNRLLELMNRHCCNRVTVETNFMWNLASELKDYARSRHQRVIVDAYHRTSNTNKKEFIAQTIEPPLHAGRFWCHRRFLISQAKNGFLAEFNDYPESKHDDHLDAVAGVVDLLRGQKAKPNPYELNRGFISGGFGDKINTYRPLAASSR